MLIDYPRKTMDAEAMLEGWELCVAAFPPGKSHADAADRLNVSRDALMKALERGRQRGDKRAFLKLRELPPLPVPRGWRKARPRRTMPA